MALPSGLVLEDVAVATFAAEASYFGNPDAGFLATRSEATAQGLSSVDLTDFLPPGSTDSFDAGNVFQGGSVHVSDRFATDQGLRDAFASAFLGIPATGTPVSSFLPFADSKPAEAVAFVSDGSGDGDPDTLYLALRGTDNMVDAIMGGQTFSPDGQAAYFMMLMPFFDAALAYALDQGFDRIVVAGGSLGGSMVDLFSLFLMPTWETQISVSAVSAASAGLADGVIAELGTALGIPMADWPVVQGDGTIARPDNHMNAANTQDIIAHPDLLPGYLVSDLLMGNHAIAGAVDFDQVTIDGTVADLQTDVFGAEHSRSLYLATLAAYAFDRPDVGDVQALAGSRVIVGSATAGDVLGAGSAGTVLGLGGNDRLTAGAGNQTLIGGDGNDTLAGGAGDDWYLGGAGTDRAELAVASGAITVSSDGDVIEIVSTQGTDSFAGIESFAFSDGVLTLAEVLALIDSPDGTGTTGDDLLLDTAGAQAFDGLEGNDTVSYADAAGRVLADLGMDASGLPSARFFTSGAPEGDTYANVENLIGSDQADNLRGDGGDNILEGGGVSDRLYGRAGDDTLIGGSGADALYGNLGADVMTGGDDAGRRDRYIYFQLQESGVGAGNRDVITDFVSGEDRIEISRFDADITQGFKQAFTFVGDAGLSGAAGELAYRFEGGNTIVEADVNGDGAADFEIELTGRIDLVVGDFLL